MGDKKVKKRAEKKYPFVTIILVNYNGWRDTIECLESVFRNDYPAYQVIVCDNGSIDGSVEKIAEWADGKKGLVSPVDEKMGRFSAPPVRKPVPYTIVEGKKKASVFKADTKLVLVHTGGNLGFAGGNNVGIRGASGYADYFWLLNNDTVMEKNALTEMVRLAQSDEKIGVVGSKLLFYREPDTLQNFGNLSIGWKGVGGSFLSNEKDRPLEDTEVRSVIGASLLIGEKVIRSVGLMDENYFMQDEETDWCVRAAAAWYKVFSCAGSRIYHKEGKSSDRSRKEKSFLSRKSSRVGTGSFLIAGYYSVRNEIYFVKKNYPGKFILYAILILPVKIIRLVLGIIFFLDENPFIRFHLIFRGVWDGLLGKMGMTIDPAEWKARLNSKGKLS